ncbi:3-phosphoshikimate 1-carboxyvinyltransferase [Melghirimyces algeriensis]|uniref:3-phosphoshikimate 1-carboxyvinyltransferase n=1 Tax=Melghirimyces algeriensis TaxID=910412 RepID=A0A521B6V9_9BACL|nr:3-phosphoshikimate 1-carboxyvinyltransferase [Melghirimyces algeriensis]SMO42838.1 3-phosphoshikimate 1-carboxyvinyltransferase [Melghirimyces algeriensis]
MLRMEKRDKLRGTVSVPGDKSISHRAVMFGAVAQGMTQVDGFLPGADCLSTIQCFRQLGVNIQRVGPTSLHIEGRGWDGLTEPDTVLDVGNSGTTIRLMMGLLAGRPFHTIVTGDESIGRRPMDRVVQPLRLMGATLDGRSDASFTPLSIRGGGLKGISYQSPVASAQVKSCLLLAGLQAEGRTQVKEPSPSRDHTERMLNAFGVKVDQSPDGVSVEGGQVLQARDVQVPGDISSAAFLMVAALITPDSCVTIQHVGLNPTRTGILDILTKMGGDIQVAPTGEWCGEPVGDITVSYSALKGVEVSGEVIPRLIDEIPVLAVAATQAEGRTVIRDAAELKVKETDRIAMTAGELRKLGAQVEETDDGMIIEGKTALIGDQCDSHGDHRIGMAMAVAGLVAKGGVTVERPEAIDVSFPGFEAVFSRLS